jgi:signal transduction histidine kinase
MEAISNNQGSEFSLRQRALNLLKGRQLASNAYGSATESITLIHELQLHQIELEIQNEELELSKQVVKESAEKYIELYNSLPVGYFTLSKSGIIIELNLCGSQMLEKDQTSLRGSQIGFFITDDTRPQFNLFLANTFNGITKQLCEVCLGNSQNSTVCVRLTGAVSSNEGECHISAVDISDLRKVELEIKQKNKELSILNAEKDKLFTLLAHDLRSPFTAFLGLTEILEKKTNELKHESIRNIASSLKRSAANVFHLVENLLVWARLQQGLATFNPEIILLADAISNSIEAHFDFASQKDLDFQVQIPPEMFVYVDLVMLESILRNLLTNAMKFSKRGGSISIKARVVDANFAEITITDNGIGMSPELMSNIFSINNNSGRSGTEGEQSTGLGLVLCKDFVEKNGGTIWVKSAEGKGSAFSFTLPLGICDIYKSNQAICNI